MKNVKHLLLVSLLFVFYMTNFIESGLAASIAPSPPMRLAISESLLSGMTPSKYSLPAGWTLVRTQNFESGSIAGDEWIAGATAAVTGAGEKRGSYALRGFFSHDGSALDWGLNGSTPTGQFLELYFSYYEWVDTNARFNTEFTMLNITKGISPDYHRVIANYFNAPVFNGTTMPYVIQGEGLGLGMADHAFAKYGPTRTVPVGRWVQREIWFRPNTPTGKTTFGSGYGDGFMRIYEDGVLVHSQENANLNGSVDMRQGVWFQVGGLYTSNIWWKIDNTCIDGNVPGEGGSHHETPNNSWDKCACPNECPPDGKIPTFYRYLDDIIVMKR